MDKSALSFLSSIDDDYVLLYYDVLGSQAHAVMLHEIGVLSRNDLIKVLHSLNRITKEKKLLEEYGNPNSEDIHELVESAVIGMTGIEVGGKMHTARSRNDQVILDIRMKIRDDINTICKNLLVLIDTLVQRAKENIDTIMPMYTHLQHAQLGVFSHYLLCYSYSLIRDFDRFFELYERIDCSPLGACAIGGSSIEIDRERVSSMLGFSDLVYNSIDATSSRDYLVEYGSNSLISMLDLCKMAEDIIIWSTNEFGFLSLDDQFSSSSSVMPQKKNPDPLELIRGKTGTVNGLVQSIYSVMKGIPSGYSRDLQEIKPLLWKVSLILNESILITNNIVRTFEVKKERMYRVSSESYAISLDIAEQLIKIKKIPLRYSHRIIGGLVDYAEKKGNIPLRNLTIEDISKALGGFDDSLKMIEPSELHLLIKDITPENSIKYRMTKGSPKRGEQLEMIRYISNRLLEYENKINSRINILDNRLNDMRLTVEKYLANR
ncbi:MAG: argininosuccinate lyase [Thermoproteota archaeon]|nr:argininosuccinate lyase [Thermoproteota archaeon]